MQKEFRSETLWHWQAIDNVPVVVEVLVVFNLLLLLLPLFYFVVYFVLR